MSTTFKDGLREAMAKAAMLNCASCVAQAIRGERTAALLDTKDAVIVAAAALAYCDEWEERTVAHYGQPAHICESWYSYPVPMPSGLNTQTILVRREPPKPTRAERVEKAAAKLKAVVRSVGDRIPSKAEFAGIEVAVDRFLAAQKED